MRATIIFLTLLGGNRYCKSCMPTLDFCLQSNIDYQTSFPSSYLRTLGMQMIIAVRDFFASVINKYEKYKREYNEKMKFYDNCITIKNCRTELLYFPVVLMAELVHAFTFIDVLLHLINFSLSPSCMLDFKLCFN